MLRIATIVLAATLLGSVGGCHPTASPTLRVLGVQDPSRQVVFVQVTNPASRPMRLTKLDYTFAADGATVATGEVALARDVQPGAAVVVEVPLDDTPAKKRLVLRGEITAELDEIVQIFPVQAQIEPH
jgi:hypothetical protein